MKYKMTVEKFLANGYLFVEGDSYLSCSGMVNVIGRDICSAIANTKYREDNKRFVISAKCLEEKEMTDYIKIENPNIFALEDDFESGELYHERSDNKFSRITSINRLCHLISDDINIYRKQHWTDKLDGTEENGVWCMVWDGDWSPEVISLDFISSINYSIDDRYIGTASWEKAEPVPQAMVDFINRKQ